jgi:hypothetical protein
MGVSKSSDAFVAVARVASSPAVPRGRGRERSDRNIRCGCEVVRERRSGGRDIRERISDRRRGERFSGRWSLKGERVKVRSQQRQAGRSDNQQRKHCGHREEPRPANERALRRIDASPAWELGIAALRKDLTVEVLPRLAKEALILQVHAPGVFQVMAKVDLRGKRNLSFGVILHAKIWAGSYIHGSSLSWL